MPPGEFWEGLFPVRRRLLPVPSPGGGLMGAPIPPWGPHPHDPVPSPRPHPYYTVALGTGFQYMYLGDTNTETRA